MKIESSIVYYSQFAEIVFLRRLEPSNIYISDHNSASGNTTIRIGKSNFYANRSQMESRPDRHAAPQHGVEDKKPYSIIDIGVIPSTQI